MTPSAQVLEHRPVHVGAAVAVEVRGDDPDVAAGRARHLPLGQRGDRVPVDARRWTAAPPDAEHLLDERVQRVGLASASRGRPRAVGGPHVDGVVVLTVAIDELARPVRPRRALVEEEPPAEVRPRRQLVDGERRLGTFVVVLFGTSIEWWISMPLVARRRKLAQARRPPATAGRRSAAGRASVQRAVRRRARR